MKKSFVLLLAFILFISGTACYAQNTLLKEKDQVHFIERVIYGDKSVVEDAVVEMYTEYESQLFWHTTYEIGEEPKETTIYEFYPWYEYNYEYHPIGSLDIIHDYDNVTMGGYADEEKVYSGLDAAMKELYDQTEPGKENQVTVYLKDYIDYYTFGMDLQLPEEEGKEYKSYYDYDYMWVKDLKEQIAKLEASGRNKEELKKAKKALYDLENFQNFFKIPVLEKEAYCLAIAKDEKGEIIGCGESSIYGGSGTGDIEIPNSPEIEGADAFSFRLWYAFEDGDCYITFDPHTHLGNTVDISQIPGGYGIYHFSYDSEKGEIDSENIEMVYALDTSTIISNLAVDESGKNLFLVTEENNRTYLSIIQRETMTLIDKFDMCDSETYFGFWSFENYMVTQSDTFAVFTMDEAGKYTQEFAVDMNTWDADISFFDSSFDWDGETLLVGCCVYHEQRGRTCDFLVAAINETGLVYYGEYSSSLTTSDVTYSPCMPENSKVNPVMIHWKHK